MWALFYPETNHVLRSSIRSAIPVTAAIVSVLSLLALWLFSSKSWDKVDNYFINRSVRHDDFLRLRHAKASKAIVAISILLGLAVFMIFYGIPQLNYLKSSAEILATRTQISNSGLNRIVIETLSYLAVLMVFLQLSSFSREKTFVKGAILILFLAIAMFFLTAGLHKSRTIELLLYVFGFSIMAQRVLSAKKILIVGLVTFSLMTITFVFLIEDSPMEYLLKRTIVSQISPLIYQVSWDIERNSFPSQNFLNFYLEKFRLGSFLEPGQLRAKMLFGIGFDNGTVNFLSAPFPADLIAYTGLYGGVIFSCIWLFIFRFATACLQIFPSSDLKKALIGCLFIFSSMSSSFFGFLFNSGFLFILLFVVLLPCFRFKRLDKSREELRLC